MDPEFSMNDDDGVDSDSDGSLDPSKIFRQKSYTIMKEEDIRRRLEGEITEIATVLSVSRVAACTLLRRYNWSVTAVHEAWFADEEGVRKAVGLTEKPANSAGLPRDQSVSCLICFESYPLDKVMCTFACSHLFCVTCWQGYISTSINDGPGCLTLRCPDPSCNAAVGQDMVDLLASEEDKNRYHRYIVRSYVEDSKNVKWCPAPGCDFAVEYEVGSEVYDVNCLCLHSFCWNCTEEVHRPVDCDTRAKWIRKNSDESENMNWILANSKPCPKCKRNIEKNKGCNHMTCGPPCLYQFCWICLGSWQNHNSSVWCNGYKEGVYKDKTTMRREKAKESLDRYTHYFERWEANLTSTKKAAADLHQMRTTKIKEISENLGKLEIELEYLVEAWVQIVECRQILTWTYAYGYYLPARELAKKVLFEFLQHQAEAALEKLHECVEREVQANFMEKISATDVVNYADFQRKLVHLTSVTRNHFEKLVTALQNDLSDVSSSSKKRKRDEVGFWPQSKDKLDGWACDQCTYFNDMSATRCAMCYGPLLLEEDEE